MKTHFLFIFCMLQLLIGKGHGSFAPLTLLADKDDDHYELSDLEMIKQKNHSLPEDHQILLCCPQIMENDVFGIVVEKTCDNVESCDHTCQHQYQPSMRQNEGLNTYETGYEIFNTNDDNDEYIWIPVLIIDFDKEPKLVIIGSRHHITPHAQSDGKSDSNEKSDSDGKSDSNGKSETCKDFSVGKQYLDELNLNLDQLYHQTNQNKILADVLVKPIDTTDRKQSTEIYLMPHQLSPIDDFDETSCRLATCSYLNTAPIWESISQGSLKRVENFIRDVADRINRVSVVTGVYDVLQLPLKEPSGTSTKPINLDGEKNNIPIPRIIYKTILYAVPQVHDSIQPPLHSGIFIITHNQFKKLDHTERLCTTEGICERNGWYVENTLKEMIF